ncbi:hypothetical protein GGX14DRAFT_431573 [Mycena pura]|uniref:SET domain-containing protein n=1 Tax=Mycena pura TaxID=153505 RepID=A0AAD6YHQ5_9AGAR|nr:hypothetical protein GGX14DRAFT_431573 [Mycena pura]
MSDVKVDDLKTRIPFRKDKTWFGGRGLFATQPIPKDTLIHTCPVPYASVIYRDFRKEVCAQCFAYAFDARRSSWNVKLAEGSGVWFCSEACRGDWARAEGAELVSAVNTEVDRLAKSMEKDRGKRAAASCRSLGSVPEPEAPSAPPALTQEAIDQAWAAGELATHAKTKPGSAPETTLDELELEDVRFVLSALVRRYIDDWAPTAAADMSSNLWTDVLQLQNHDLPYILARPQALVSHLRVYTFIRRVVRSIRVLEPYLATSEAVRAVLARKHGNVFGMYEMNTEGDSEMFGWSMYVSASYFNHDCAPNVRKERAGRAMCFYTTRDVAYGEELCINYIDLKDTVTERREQLRLNWYFDCVCDRCNRELETR